MSVTEWAELIRVLTLMISALGTVFGGLITVQTFKQALEIKSLKERVQVLQGINTELSTKLTELNGVITEYTRRLNSSLDLLGTRNNELATVHADLAKGVGALSSASERIEKLREVIRADGDRATLDKGLREDDQDKLEQQTKGKTE